MFFGPKKWIGVALLATVIAGCGGGTGNEEADNTATAEATDGTATAQRFIPIGSSKGYLLTVTPPTNGKVTSSLLGIDCGASATRCAARFTSGSVVTLTATPSSGYKFSGWSGACTGTSTCTVTIAGDLLVSAAFGTSSTPTPPPSVHTVQLSWSPAVEATVTGYKVYHGTQSGVYTDSFASAVTSTSYSTSVSGSHFFAVRAVDTNGNESPSSAEVSIAIP
ncbi:InlB B-repeat-containing protein [Ideonella sp. BN130291]|uniref:InlB B-repeat-containing protein n=1 Tax=Ideonella sp. BN130291 TaxID=3112940 RepID=UPI002E258850|nr:hypothetical protein [Ideonella sp. BN130291]